MPKTTFSKMIHGMHVTQAAAPTGKDFFKSFISAYADMGDEKYTAVKTLLVSTNWDYRSVIEVMNINMLKDFELWMAEKGYIAFGWTGYDGDTVDDYYQGRMLKWFRDPVTKNNLVPRYTEYSGCRVQFIESSSLDEEESLVLSLLSEHMGTHGGAARNMNIHDRDNDILAGRKVVVFRDLEGICHLFYSKLNPVLGRQTIASAILNDNITSQFCEEYFFSKKMYGTLTTSGVSDIPNTLLEQLDIFILEHGGESFFACWNAIYVSRFPRVYGGYVETDITGEEIAKDAAMNRIFIHESLLESDRHVVLPEIDVENTGLANHLARELQERALYYPIALTVPERLMDEDDRGEETILMGSGLPGMCISVPVSREISTACLKLAVYPQDAHKCGISSDDVEYIERTYPKLDVSRLSIEEVCKSKVKVESGALEFSFEYNGKFVFSYDFIQKMVMLGKSLKMIDFNFSDSNGDTMAMYAAKNGYIAMLKILGGFGADLWAVNPINGRDLLSYARVGGHIDIVNMLLSEVGIKYINPICFTKLSGGRAEDKAEHNLQRFRLKNT